VGGSLVAHPDESSARTRPSRVLAPYV
jgi:hypothetical protein